MLGEGLLWVTLIVGAERRVAPRTKRRLPKRMPPPSDEASDQHSKQKCGEALTNY